MVVETEAEAKAEALNIYLKLNALCCGITYGLLLLKFGDVIFYVTGIVLMLMIMSPPVPLPDPKTGP